LPISQKFAEAGLRKGIYTRNAADWQFFCGFFDIKVIINEGPAAIYDALEKWADDEFRSVNAQIELLIKKSLKDSGRLKKNRGKGSDEE
jgi:hypothetical protein